MTVVFIDPIHGAALTAGLLPILPALPCPTCGGKRWLRAPVPHDEVLPGRSCPDCSDGVWTPPDSPVTIGVTSARPEVGAHDGYIVCSVIPKGYVPDYEADDDDFYEASGRGLMTNDEWAHKFDDISNHNPPHPIVLSSMIGEGTLRPLKVVDFRSRIDGLPGVVEITHGSERRGLRHWFKTTDGIWDWADISSALPFLPGLKPGDTVYLLDGFTASVECPECHGYCCLPIRLGSDGLFGGGGQCPSCLGTGRLSCPFPVDAPDHPCVQP